MVVWLYIVVEVAMAKVQQAWVMLQWCGGYNKGVLRFSDCCNIGEYSTVKVVAIHPLYNGALFKWEFWSTYAN